MKTGEENGQAHAARDKQRIRRKTPWPLIVVAALFVIVPFLTWYGTWFGRELSDEKIDQYFSERDNPRRIQHALSQIGERIEERKGGTERWYPQVIDASRNEIPDVRMTAAWVMGLEHGREDFHQALLGLIEDSEPIVRRNAALALVRFGDERCRRELLLMLRPFPVTSSSDGRALAVLSEGTHVKRGMMLTRIRIEEERSEEVRAPLPGKIIKTSIKEGDEVRKGAQLFLLAPDSEHVRDALVGLYYFGKAEDLPEIERFAEGVEGMPDKLKSHARETAEAVRRRMTKTQ